MRNSILTLITLTSFGCDAGPALDGAVRLSNAPPLIATTHPAPTARRPLVVTDYTAEVAPGSAPLVIPSGTQTGEYNDQHGRSIVFGDFNGDGRTDVAVGLPFEDIGAQESAGSVIVYRGSAAGLAYSQALTQSGLGADEPLDHFGFALAAGDFDGDGKDDLAVGAPEEAVGGDPASGAVFIFRGSTGNMAAAWVIDQETLALDTNELGDRFGEALSSADYDGDGKDDLAIGAPGEGNDTGVRSGAVYVARGTVPGMVGMKKLGQAGLGPAEAYDRFGSSLASGDFFTAAGNDLVVGCYNDRVGQRSGAAFVFRGGAGGPFAHARLVQPGLNETGDLFARALAVGDFDDDGLDDLAVGAPGEDRAMGAVYLFRSNGGGLMFDETIDPSAIPGSKIGDRFGAALAAADYDGDGKSDLAVAAPRAVVNSTSTSGIRDGRILLLRSTGASMSAVGSVSKKHFAGAAQDDQFGHALAFGRADNLGNVWLAAGAPARTQVSVRAGSAFVFRGTGGGKPSAWRALVQN